MSYCYFFAQKSSNKEVEVKNMVAVHILNQINATITREDSHRLLLVEAHGQSREEPLGRPRLVLRTPREGGPEDMLEFDFMVELFEEPMKKILNYEVSSVFNVEELPLHPKWIKVNAGQNADIALVNDTSEL